MIRMIIMMQSMMNGMDIQYHYLIWVIMMKKIEKLMLHIIMLIEKWKKEGRSKFKKYFLKNHL